MLAAGIARDADWDRSKGAPARSCVTRSLVVTRTGLADRANAMLGWQAIGRLPDGSSHHPRRFTVLDSGGGDQRRWLLIRCSRRRKRQRCAGWPLPALTSDHLVDGNQVAHALEGLGSDARYVGYVLDPRKGTVGVAVLDDALGEGGADTRQ